MSSTFLRVSEKENSCKQKTLFKLAGLWNFSPVLVFSRPELPLSRTTFDEGSWGHEG